MGASGGYVYPMPGSASGMPDSFVKQMVQVTVNNIIDPGELFRQGFAANPDLIVNHVAGNVRNKGIVMKSMERYGK